MNKRQFLTGSIAGFGGFALCGTTSVRSGDREHRNIRKSGVEFRWHHAGDRLHGTLSAPTRGWIAVGFNNTATLRNTRFVMAAVSVAPIRISERIALVPRHANVAEAGGTPALEHATGGYAEGVSKLSFSLPHSFEDRPSLGLGPGTKVHLMLAWSRETDFEHHSAWRQHFAITL